MHNSCRHNLGHGASDGFRNNISVIFIQFSPFDIFQPISGSSAELKICQVDGDDIVSTIYSSGPAHDVRLSSAGL
jgi:hypothetical protein